MCWLKPLCMFAMYQNLSLALLSRVLLACRKWSAALMRQGFGTALRNTPPAEADTVEQIAISAHRTAYAVLTASPTLQKSLETGSRWPLVDHCWQLLISWLPHASLQIL